MKKENRDANYYIECECHADEHRLVFKYIEDIFGDGTENEIYTAIYLRSGRGFFHRVWLGLKYMFGYTSRFGHFTCTIINTESAKGLIKFLEKITKDDKV